MSSLGHFAQNTQFVGITGSPLALFEQRDLSTTMKNDFFSSIGCHAAIVRRMNLALPLRSLFDFPGVRDACFGELDLPSFIQDHACLLVAESCQTPTHPNTTIRQAHNVTCSWSGGLWSGDFYYHLPAYGWSHSTLQMEESGRISKLIYSEKIDCCAISSSIYKKTF